MHTFWNTIWNIFSIKNTFSGI
ncbi:hypothetical protein ESX12_14230 [Polaribacter glomeratus]|nr:hypothetical protein ESX12_14230 [Polaribacter glomeratus]